MKRIPMINTAVLSLALGVAAPVFAQQEQHDQQDEQKAKSGQEEKSTKPEKSAKPEQKSQAEHEKNAKPEEKNAQQQDRNSKSAEQQHPQQPQNEKQAHAGGGRIPDDRFKASFGEQHRFRVSQADYSRDHRFLYGGYTFVFVDQWPSNWLYTQDVYVIEINGVYYLCNPTYPGVNIALSFTL